MKKSIKVIALILTLILVASVFALIGCDNNKEYVVEEEKVFYLDVKQFDFLNLGIASLIIDKNASQVILRPDGTATLRIVILEDVVGALGGLITEDMLAGLDITPLVDQYAVNIVPGFDINKPKETFKLLEDSMGIKFYNVDFDDPNVKALFDVLAGHGTLPEDFMLPAPIGIEYNCNYTMEDLVSEYTGEYTAVYMGDKNEGGEPYVVMTMETNPETQKQEVFFEIKFLNVTFRAVER